MAEHVWMTSQMLKAMTHPVRRRIMTLMTHDRPMRAADLAKRLGEPANSVSFHLRKLAEAGMIVEAPERARDRRDRVWVAVGTGYGVPPPGVLRSEDEDLLLRAFLDQAGIDLQDLVARALAWVADWGTGRVDVRRAELNTATASLTRSEAEQLIVEVGTAIQRARQRWHENEPSDGQERQDWEVVFVAAEANLRRELANGGDDGVPHTKVRDACDH